VVGAVLEGEDDFAAVGVAILGGVGGGEEVDGLEGFGAGIVDGLAEAVGLVAAGVGVLDAVDEVVVVVGVVAVDVGEGGEALGALTGVVGAADGTVELVLVADGDAGGELGEFGEVVAVDGQRVDQGFGDRGADHAVFGVEDGREFAVDDDVGLGADGQLGVDLDDLADLQRERLGDVGREAVRGDGDLVGADLEEADAVNAVAVADGGGLDIGGEVGRGDFGAGDESPAGIGDQSADVAGGGLGERGSADDRGEERKGQR
jgi:hypothetical protein